MPVTKYLKLTIGDKEVHVTSPEDLPISIDYALEDPDNFQNKESSKAYSIKVPASLLNDKAGNTFHNPDIMDLTTGESFRSNQPFVIDENGFEIMNGKAFMSEVTHDAQPLEYEYDLFGDNANWKIDLEESTLFDFLQHINFVFSKANIIDSWAYDGTDPAKPYVFAPVRYRAPMGGTTLIDGQSMPDDGNVLPVYLKPSLSKYWIIYWALKSVGFRIQSTFFDQPYFRRQVMPWTWGNFLNSEGTRFDVHRFKAKSLFESYFIDADNTIPEYVFWDFEVLNDSTDGMFDNNVNSSNPAGDYTYDPAAREMKWTYNAPDFNTIDATFSLILNIETYVSNNSEAGLRVHWYVNGVEKQVDQVIDSSSPLFGQSTGMQNHRVFFTAKEVELGAVVTAKIAVYLDRSSRGSAAFWATVDQFQLDYIRIPLGGTINFFNYPGFKKYKFLDFLRGIIDEFNLSINTDPINKVVYIEPTHSYSINNDPIATLPGYFVDDFIDWNKKMDLSKEWKMQNYKDYDRELTFCYKDDANDGILKVVQDRNLNRLAAGKYVFPERFKAGKKEYENRFFSATMHYEANQWKEITDIAPQLVCLIPENIANTSNSEAENTFVPKSCYYKGLETGVGGWVFDKYNEPITNGVRTEFPFMFAVNYKDGGQNDPILSYGDERISAGAGHVIGKGLLKRFFWQRLAIMRNGQFYKTTWFRLKNVDVANQLHREYKSFAGHRWELVQITGYKPLQDLSTNCFFRRWAPISEEDFNNTFPSADNLLTNTSTNTLDIKYAPLLGLTSDIPR